MDFDDILKEAGEFGRYQKLLVVFVIFPACLPSGFHGFSQIFTAATPKEYFCNIATPENNLSIPETIHLLPKELDEDGRPRTSRCKMYDVDGTSWNSSTRLAEFPQVPCKNGWWFNRSVYESTIVTEWDLVCDKEIYSTLSTEIHTIGTLLGSLVFGYLADRFGRKLAYYIASVMQLVTGLLTAASPNYIIFCIIRFFNGCTIVPTWILPLIMGLELIGPSKRAAVGVGMSVFYTLGVVGLAGVAYGVRSWVPLQFAVSLPFLYTLSYWWLLPESPRWLVSQGRHKEMLTIIKKIAKVNRRPLSTDYIIMVEREFRTTASNAANLVTKQYVLWDLFRTPNLRRKTCLIVFNSFANYAVYNGLNFFGPHLGHDDHLNFLLCSLVELPSYLILFVTLDRTGRRSVLMSSMVIGGAFCIIAAILPSSQEVAVMLLFLLSIFCITCSFFVTDLVASEIFPTVVRGAGASLTQTISAIGLCTSPIIAHFAKHYVFIPLIIFGALAILGGGVTMFLPETCNMALPETLEEGEEFGKNMTWRQRMTFRPPRRTPLPPANQAVMPNGKDAPERLELLSTITSK